MVFGHRIITSAKQVFGNFTITERLFVPSCWGVALDTNRALELTLTLRVVHLINHLLLLILLLLTIVILFGNITRDTKVHEGFDSLLSLWRLWLQFVERIVEDLSVVGEQFTEFKEINFDDLVFREKLTDYLEDVTKSLFENVHIHLSLFAHVGIIWFLEWFH